MRRNCLKTKTRHFTSVRTDKIPVPHGAIVVPNHVVSPLGLPESTKKPGMLEANRVFIIKDLRAIISQ
jgi:hypothetical protein